MVLVVQLSFGRDCASEAYQMCIAAGVKVSGMNTEVGPDGKYRLVHVRVC